MISSSAFQHLSFEIQYLQQSVTLPALAWTPSLELGNRPLHSGQPLHVPTVHRSTPAAALVADMDQPLVLGKPLG
jgi:hypothetical protein